jgi:capsular exopolysaccharide synthesis family protein
MRRPSVGKTFGFPVGTPGLANVIAGNNSFAEVTQHVDGIDVISAGTVPPNPLELLSSKRFDELLTELEGQYDRIIIDSAPTQAVSDAVVLAQHANAVIYVVKSDATKVPLVRGGVGQLLQHNAPITGVVLNQVDIKKAQKYGYSYGGYYDYYGYSKGSA